MRAKEGQGYSSHLKYNQDELALSYLPAVKAMGYRLKERLPSSVDVADLVSIGTEELIKLARRYDEALNDSFWGFAKTRIYGAMLDYLRSLDVVSRGSRKLIKRIDLEVSHYLNEHAEEPSDEYLAELLGEDVKKIREAKVASDIHLLLPLEDQLSALGEEATEVRIEQEELVEVITAILGELEEREQLVIQLYYFEELNLKEISEVLEVSESRISQIHKEVIKKIRSRLGGV